jgi:hypothetical protein
VTSAAPVSTQDVQLGARPVSFVADNVPGVVGEMFWLLRAGTTVGIDLTTAAYVATALR